MEKVTENEVDLILLDIMMPKMSGFEVCRKLKADPKTRDIVIIMVTALNETGDIERAAECGTDDYISKPLRQAALDAAEAGGPPVPSHHSPFFKIEPRALPSQVVPPEELEFAVMVGVLLEQLSTEASLAHLSGLIEPQ